MLNPIDFINRITSPYEPITRNPRQSDIRSLKSKAHLYLTDLQENFLTENKTDIYFTEDSKFNQGILLSYFGLTGEEIKIRKAINHIYSYLKEPGEINSLDLAALRFGINTLIKYTSDPELKANGINTLLQLENRAYATLGPKNNYPREVLSNLVTYEILGCLLKKKVLNPRFYMLDWLCPKILWKEDWEAYAEILFNFQSLLYIKPKFQPYIKGINRIWKYINNHGNSLLTYVYHSATKAATEKELKDAEVTLNEFSVPESKAVIQRINSNEYPTRKYLFKTFGPKVATQPIPHWKRPASKFTWTENPYILDGHILKPNISTNKYHGLDFLVARVWGIELDLLRTEA